MWGVRSSLGPCLPYHPHPHIIICTSFISSIDYNVFFIVIQCHLKDHSCRKVTQRNNLLLLLPCGPVVSAFLRPCKLHCMTFPRTRRLGYESLPKTMRAHGKSLLRTCRLGCESLPKTMRAWGESFPMTFRLGFEPSLWPVWSDMRPCQGPWGPDCGSLLGTLRARVRFLVWALRARLWDFV